MNFRKMREVFVLGVGVAGLFGFLLGFGVARVEVVVELEELNDADHVDDWDELSTVFQL